MHSFIAPYARGHGLARMLTMGVEERARELGYHVLNLDVRETQEAAIRLYESLGFVRWGVHPDYALVRGKSVRGFFYYKRLRRPNARTGGSRRAGLIGADAVSGDRPEGRPVRAPAPRRDGPGDGLFRPIRRLRRAPGRMPGSPGCTWST